eukprot:PhF_6_TR31399/c0_g1_i1/m.45999
MFQSANESRLTASQQQEQLPVQAAEVPEHDMVSFINDGRVKCEHVPTLQAVIQELNVQAQAIENHVVFLDRELREATFDCEQLKKRVVEQANSAKPVVYIADDEDDDVANSIEKEIMEKLVRRQAELKLDVERITHETDELRTRLYDMQKGRNIRTTVLDSLVLGKPTHSRNVYTLQPPGPEELYGVGRDEYDSTQYDMFLISLRYLTLEQDTVLCSEGYYEAVRSILKDARNQLLDAEEAKALGMSDRYSGMPLFSLDSAVAAGMGRVGGSLELRNRPNN